MSFIFEKLSHSIWAFISIIPLATLGAVSNVYARNSASYIGIILLFVMSLLVTIPWAVIVRHSAISLAVSSALFDALYDTSYFVAFIALGESATPIQWVGAGLTVCGIVLLSL